VERSERAELQRQLTRLADGDREAFRPVFLMVWPLVRGLALRSLPLAEAEDAAQDALLKLFARAGEFDPTRDALAWVLGVAAWEVRTARTRQRRRREVPEEPTPAIGADPGSSPEEQVVAQDLAHAVAQALDALGPADAETLRAYAHGERPEIPPATFRKRVERALRRLRKLWRSQHGAL
jgi:RNA polymerase sigma-70 factor (ECF subfamily)